MKLRWVELSSQGPWLDRWRPTTGRILREAGRRQGRPRKRMTRSRPDRPRSSTWKFREARVSLSLGPEVREDLRLRVLPRRQARRESRALERFSPATARAHRQRANRPDSCRGGQRQGVCWLLSCRAKEVLELLRRSRLAFARGLYRQRVG